MTKIKSIHIKLGLLVLLNCLANFSTEAVASSGGGVMDKVADFLHLKGSDKDDLQRRYDDQQQEIVRLKKIEATANEEHKKHVAAEKLAGERLKEIQGLTEQLGKIEAEAAAKDLEIQKKEEALGRKVKGSKNHTKLTDEIVSLQEQLAVTKADALRLAAEQQEATTKEEDRKIKKAKAQREAAEAVDLREEAEQHSKELEQQLLEERTRTAALEHDNAVKARELLDAQHIIERERVVEARQARQAGQIATLHQQLREKDQESKRDHFIAEIKGIHLDASAEAELLAYISNPSAFFSDSVPIVYQTLKEKVKADDAYGPAYDLAVSHIMMHSKTADIKDYWTKFIVAMPTPSGYRGDNIPLKLVSTLHKTLKDETHSDPILDAYSSLLENTLANGGCFGINFENSATDEDLKVMIPALRLSGSRAISKIISLAEALEVILSAYWYIEYSAAPLQDGEDIIFESHRRNTTLAAVQVLKKTYNEDEILDGLEKADVVTNTSRAYAKDMWAYYDQFDK